MNADGYASFLVRCWREPTEGEQTQQWCCEVEQIQSGERHCFQTLAELFAFLLDATIPPTLTPQPGGGSRRNKRNKKESSM